MNIKHLCCQRYNFLFSDPTLKNYTADVLAMKESWMRDLVRSFLGNM